MHRTAINRMYTGRGKVWQIWLIIRDFSKLNHSNFTHNFLFICQTFPSQTLIRANSPNFLLYLVISLIKLPYKLSKLAVVEEVFRTVISEK